MSANDNGERPAVALDEVVLTFDRAADYLQISGTFNSLDLALYILARATRMLEARWRKMLTGLAAGLGPA